MKKFNLFVFALFWFFQSNAQKEIQSFGKVDIADLEMKECSFEKDANAMVLFEENDIYFDQNFDMTIEVHKRIKILNEKGKDEASVRLIYYSGGDLEKMMGFQAQTINLVNGKPEIIKVEKKTIFTEVVDKNRSSLVFSFPAVQAGSIIEYKYKMVTWSLSNFPTFYFQGNIPVRYSQITTTIPEYLYYKTHTLTTKSYIKNIHKQESRSLGSGADVLMFIEDKDIRAMANVPSLVNEPFMTSRKDNLESVDFQLVTVRPPRGFVKTLNDTWLKVGETLVDDEDFGRQLKRKISGEDAILAKAKTMNTKAEKIAYIFNEVRNSMKWNGYDVYYTNDGTSKAWEKKTGNSTEVNLILYHLLKEAGLDAYPMVVSTRDNGKVNVVYPGIRQFNRTIAYIPVDSTYSYYLDATDKYQLWNEIPEDLLNTNGLIIDKYNKTYTTQFIQRLAPVRRVSYVNAEIKPEGKIVGTAIINAICYDKMKYTKLFKRDGEDKMKEFLTDKDNNLKISSLKLENIDVDTLPLTQKLDFSMDLTESDGDYIYFNANMFSGLKNNPFLSENRLTDIDMNYKGMYLISGTYKIPKGFKAEVLPKNISMVMPDQSLSFKRVAQEQDGIISVRYTVDCKKTILFKEDYETIREFYKKLYDMLNEKIVLKKS